VRKKIIREGGGKKRLLPNIPIQEYKKGVVESLSKKREEKKEGGEYRHFSHTALGAWRGMT